ncbi:MAG: ATP-dependent helicase [Methylobacter sp.]|nr:ATP-dependent helicase [Methylobacter sp.]
MKVINETPLTKEQINIVNHKRGVAIVFAGAGTGKTHTLVFRVKKLIDQGCRPENIQLLTFARKADSYLKSKLISNPCYSQVKCSTFHAFGLQLIKAHSNKLGFTATPKVVLDRSLDIVVKNIITDIAANRKVNHFKLTKVVKNSRKTKRTCLRKSKSPLSMALAEVLNEFQSYKLRHNIIDHQDMLNLAVKLLQTHPEIRTEMATGIEHLMVDELQDISGQEVSLIYNLAKRTKSTLLVGDKKQAIFSFRGSDLKCWEQLEALLSTHYKSKLKHFNLTKSHRLPEQLLPLVNAVAADICDDPPLTSAKPGCIPHLFIAQNNDQQGGFIAKEINKLLAEGVLPEEIVILGRTRKSLFAMKNHLSYQKIDTTETYRKSKATTEKALRALIRITKGIARGINNSKTPAPPTKSWLRVLHYLQLPEAVQETVSEEVLENGWDAFNVPKKTGDSERLYQGISKLRKTVIKAAELELEAGTQLLIDALSRFITHKHGKKETALLKRDLSNTKIAMRIYNTWSEVDLAAVPLTYTQSGVPLYILHSAKGREWRFVFIINVVEKYLPFYWNRKGNLDEEYRVFYVAITRASEKLYLIQCPIVNTLFIKNGSAKEFKQTHALTQESQFVRAYKYHFKQVK